MNPLPGLCKRKVSAWLRHEATQFVHGINPFAGRYGDVGSTPTGILHKALTDPGALVHAVATWHKLLYVALLLVPFLGLCLLEPRP